MMRQSLALALVSLSLAFSAPAEAQRRGAEITQGMTSADFAATAETLRAQNAELGARLTGLESDRAELSGEVETLKFLLSQSRDQINRMQEDDAELDRLIGRLEDKLDSQSAQIRSLEARLDDVESAGVVMSDENFDVASVDTASEAEPVVTTTTTTGPTRIVRRTTVQPSEGETSNGLPQGSLGTISASALPGEAGPLFAEAKSRLLQFDYAGAEAAFRSFLDQFGDDQQAGEAQYWLGEVLFQQQAYAESGQAFTTMIREYPDDPRSPEALAKLARSMRLVGDTDKACNALDILPSRYPEASGVTKNLAAGERVRSGCDS